MGIPKTVSLPCSGLCIILFLNKSVTEEKATHLGILFIKIPLSRMEIEIFGMIA